MKKLFFIAMILTLAAGCGKSSNIEHQMSNGDEASSSSYATVVDDRLKDVNFSETGNITDWDEVTESYVNDWTLTYEIPGSPAIAVDLILDDESVCVVANEEYSCKEILTNEFNGKRLYVQGVRDGDEVRVKRITF